MPRWNFELLPGTLSSEEKETIAKRITEMYTDLGLPAFWVNVFFHENPPDSFFCGGKSPHESTFFYINHAARYFETQERRESFIAHVDSIVRPFFEPKCQKWEFNIYEHPADNWRINGMVPPIKNPEVLLQWIERDEPVPY